MGADPMPQPSSDRAAFNQLFETRYSAMLRLATGLVDYQSVAEEIVQESLHRVWLRWDDIDEPSTYLRTTVVNRCNDELRRRRRSRRMTQIAAPEAEPESDYLADALGSVPARRREALVLRYYGGRSVPEVARVMGVPTGTAKSLISRGLADLRGALAPAA